MGIPEVSSRGVGLPTLRSKSDAPCSTIRAMLEAGELIRSVDPTLASDVAMLLMNFANAPETGSTKIEFLARILERHR